MCTQGYTDYVKNGVTVGVESCSCWSFQLSLTFWKLLDLKYLSFPLVFLSSLLTLWAALFCLVWKKILGIVEWVIPYRILTVSAFCKVVVFLIVLKCCAYSCVQYLQWAGLQLVLAALLTGFFQPSLFCSSAQVRGQGMAMSASLQSCPIRCYRNMPGSLLPRSQVGLSLMICAWVTVCCSWSWA